MRSSIFQTLRVTGWASLACLLLFLPACQRSSGPQPTQQAPLKPASSLVATTIARGEPPDALPAPLKGTAPEVTISDLHASNGVTRWNYHPQWAPMFHNLGAPVIVDGVLYAPADVYNEAYSFDNDHSPSGVLSALRVSDKTLLWRVETGALASAPLVENGVVYSSAIVFTTDSQHKSLTEKFVYAFDTRTGKLLWRTRIIGSFGFNDTLALVQGNLYIGSNEVCFDACNATYLFSLHAVDGKLRWQRALTGGISIHIQSFTIANDIVYLYLYGDTSNQLVLLAFRASDGQQLWRYLTGLSLFEGNIQRLSPVVSNGLVYLGSALQSDPYQPERWSYSVVALNGQSGTVQWRTPTNLHPAVIAASAGTIYLETARTSKTTPPYTTFLSALRADDGHLLWRQHIENPLRSFIPAGTILYGTTGTILSGTTRKDASNGDTTNIVFALDAQSGALLWRTTMQSPLSHAGSLVTALASNVIYVALQDDILFAVQTRDGKILWDSRTAGTIMDVTIVT
ncbi:MAG: PQQ-binding-like beta-propeller repeat protein [Chloroflexota bacterium]|nr:PQQ-binding-like beta-propeller repeat protein [Chloroflexota bacterium]